MLGLTHGGEGPKEYGAGPKNESEMRNYYVLDDQLV
jgi:hypothetical protein